jgi:hypothetical protein
METDKVEAMGLYGNITLKWILTLSFPATLKLVYLPGQPLFVVCDLKNFTAQK